MKSKTPESIVLHQCLEYLTACGFYVWRNNTGAVRQGNRFIRFGKTGSSDIIGILPDGRFLAVECKRNKGGVITNEQKKFQEAILNNGGVSIITNSLENMVEQLKNYINYY